MTSPQTYKVASGHIVTTGPYRGMQLGKIAALDGGLLWLAWWIQQDGVAGQCHILTAAILDVLDHHAARLAAIVAERSCELRASPRKHKRPKARQEELVAKS